MNPSELPLPGHFEPSKVAEIQRIGYQSLAAAARQWADRHHLSPAADDAFRVCLLLIDVQNTFCIPDFELFVGGRSGMAAVEDNQRLCAFIYRNLGAINQIQPTMDTHQALQIFHGLFLIDDRGRHPEPFTLISAADIAAGRWHLNPGAARALGIDTEDGDRYLRHYVERLGRGGKYDLTIWPYHAMLGGIGHALVPAVEAAVFFHSVARYARIGFHVKGDNALTEHYSVLKPEILEDADGNAIARADTDLVRRLSGFDAVIIAGQAKSHCVAWTVADLLDAMDPADAGKVYLLADCASPVVIPGVVDFTDAAEAAFQRFAEAGAHIVHSTDPMSTWPGMNF